MKRTIAILAAAVVAAGLGCSKTETKTTEPAASGSAPAASSAPVASAAPSAAPAPAPEAEEPLPSHAQEDLEAVHDIQKTNYKQELDKLEKEVDTL